MGMNDKQKKQYFEYLIKSYDNGTARIRGEHPPEVEEAIDTFFKAAKILVDYPETETIPTEYINKLIVTLARFPQYQVLASELLQIVNQDEEYNG